MKHVSVIIPILNAESTILTTLKSLAKQSLYFSQIVLVDDGSSDSSISIVKKYLKKHLLKTKIKIISHPKSLGLSKSYNDGIMSSTGDIIVTLHSDVVLQKNAFKHLLEPFKDPTIVATYHQSIHPYDLWKNYNFYQQAFFDRQLGKNQAGLDGKFDAFRKKALVKVGLFDYQNFFRAGEDGDIYFKLIKIGKVVETKASILHLHDTDPKFSYQKIIYKQAQYSQAQGAFIRRYNFIGLKHLLHTFFREILIILLIVPYLRYFILFLILLYSFLYSKNTIKHNLNNYRSYLLPLLNIYLLFVSFYYSLNGFITKKQSI